MRVRWLTVLRWLATRPFAASEAKGMERERARSYNRQKEILVIVGMVLGWVTGALFLFTGSAARVRAWARRAAGRGVAGRSLAALAYTLLGSLVELPLTYYGGYTLEHRYGLSNQTRRAWAWDHLKALLVGLAFELPIVNAAYAVIRRWPRAWWWILSTLSIPFTVLMAQLGPVLILPLFNKYEPLRDRALAERLKRVAERSGIHVADVLQMDMSRQTRKANAFFAGLGPTKRIVLGDTLLKNFTPEEIEVVVAHEAAHQAHRDIWRFIALGSAASYALAFAVDRAARATLHRFGSRLGFREIDDVASLPLFGWLLALAGALLGPIQNAYSRRIERQADAFALRLTHDPQAFVDAMRRLADVNLADPAPPAIVKYTMYSHPPIAERLDHARQYAREHGLPEPTARG